MKKCLGTLKALEVLTPEAHSLEIAWQAAAEQVWHLIQRTLEIGKEVKIRQDLQGLFLFQML